MDSEYNPDLSIEPNTEIFKYTKERTPKYKSNMVSGGNDSKNQYFNSTLKVILQIINSFQLRICQWQ